MGGGAGEKQAAVATGGRREIVECLVPPGAAVMGAHHPAKQGIQGSHEEARGTSTQLRHVIHDSGGGGGDEMVWHLFFF